jgi:prevent-host-death family protein
MLGAFGQRVVGMETVDAVEAQTDFDALLARVVQGDQITITRGGKPVARLVPADDDGREARHAAVERMKAFVKEHNLTLDGDWREFRDASRKW